MKTTRHPEEIMNEIRERQHDAGRIINAIESLEKLLACYDKRIHELETELEAAEEKLTQTEPEVTLTITEQNGNKRIITVPLSCVDDWGQP